jgi:N-acyl-L-homoserine lactone synthetase
MIVVVDQHNIDAHRELVDEMFRLRARAFGQRLKWTVKIVDGMERDRFDDENPVHVIDTQDMRRVLGSLRLLPTTGPTLFSEAFADTFGDAAHLSSPSIWECTRFCVDDRLMGQSDPDGAIRTSYTLVAALGEIGLSAGIESYLGNFDASMLRVYRRVGCEVEVIGHTDKYGRRVYLGRFPVAAPILRRVLGKLDRMGGSLTWAANSWQPTAGPQAPFAGQGKKVA